MGSDFPGKFLRVAKDIIHAERGMAVDADLTLVETINLTPDIMQAPRFNDVAQTSLQKAVANGEVVITNNLITDPSQAPLTNTSFADLRLVIVVPLKGHGAIYLDQPIKKGIVPRETVEKLLHLANQLIENGLEDSSEEQFAEWYTQL